MRLEDYYEIKNKETNQINEKKKLIKRKINILLDNNQGYDYLVDVEIIIDNMTDIINIKNNFQKME